MQSIDGGGVDSPRGSMGSAAEYGAGSDVDEGARDIEEEFKQALGEFQMENEDLDSEVEDDDSHCSDRPPSSDMEDHSDCCTFQSEQEVVGSDDEVPKQAVLDKLTRLASQFSRTVEKLRKKAHVPSNTSIRSDLSSRLNPSSRFTPPMDSKELVDSLCRWIRRNEPSNIILLEKLYPELAPPVLATVTIVSIPFHPSATVQDINGAVAG